MLLEKHEEGADGGGNGVAVLVPVLAEGTGAGAGAGAQAAQRDSGKGARAASVCWPSRLRRWNPEMCAMRVVPAQSLIEWGGA